MDGEVWVLFNLGNQYGTTVKIARCKGADSVRIEAGNEEGMQRLDSYISRRPFWLARMIKVSEGGEVIYRAGKSRCVGFPRPGDERLREGVSRNFQVFDALEFLAEVTQHIPEKPALSLPNGMRRPGRRPKNVELRRVNRVMITAILSVSAFKESFLDFCAS